MERYSAKEAADDDDFNKGELINSRALLFSKKPSVRYFASYARKDDKENKRVQDFVERLEENFKCSKKFHYQGWADWKILVADDWNLKISQALEQCDFGLVLLSLPFLNSEFIIENELPRFVSSDNDTDQSFCTTILVWPVLIRPWTGKC